MVATMTHSGLESFKHGRPQRLVEVVGVAGAGKTTTVRALRDYDQDVSIALPPDVRNPANLPFYVVSGIRLLPTLVRMLALRTGMLTRRELAWMMILEGWPDVLRTRRRHDKRLVILDQGPIYLLAQVHDFGSECLRTKPAQGWWRRMCKRWAVVLDAIVWMDAPDAVLIRRILARDSMHPVKEMSAAEAQDFLNRWRLAYYDVLLMLVTSRPGLRLLFVDSGVTSTETILDRILAL